MSSDSFLPPGTDEARLKELDEKLAASVLPFWRDFYANRSDPRPFFTDAPDENLVEWIEGRHLRAGRALDVGCGNGRNALYLRQCGFDVLAVDFSPSAIRWASERVGADIDRLQLVCGSVFDLRITPGSYDLVYDSGCFHHIPPHRRTQYIDIVRSALRTGGHVGLVVFTPEGGSGLSDADTYRLGSLGGGLGYEPTTLMQLWGDGFEVLSLRRMRATTADARAFGRDFLWTVLLRKLPAPRGT